ncbi:Tfp pilus assembly protein PilE [Crenothrix polyspora]|uniref:Tfp pilus assembly protein PilE n=1 Tax=Crenothrix polyspora TaxID=360316 RepID=A0A1R4HJE2_9GAMM|nr:type IV pilin protein [Crenothrix polyspora]SJM96161.1 Tfp pilus assembly protein PilE [Crenothrix polyspora]
MKTQKGFTLIELMITVAIVGILASIAVPNYQKSVMKARRADAKGALVSLANAMERHYTETGGYCGAAMDSGVDSCGDLGGMDTGAPSIYPAQSPVDGGTKYYDLTIAAVTDNSYTLQAKRINPGAQANDECGDLTLMHTGERGIANAADGITKELCW